VLQVVVVLLYAGILGLRVALACSTIPDARQSPSLEELKIDSSLLRAMKQASSPRPRGPNVQPEPVASGGVAVVDIQAEVTERVLARIGELGGSVISSFPKYGAVRAALPLARLCDLAAMSEVRFIRPAERGTTNRGAQE